MALSACGSAENINTYGLIESDTGQSSNACFTGLTFYWGTVDGDCKMNSLKDDVKERTLVIRRAGAALLKPTLPPWRFGRDAPARARTSR